MPSAQAHPAARGRSAASRAVSSRRWVRRYASANAAALLAPPTRRRRPGPLASPEAGRLCATLGIESLEERLAEADGYRVGVQRLARGHLSVEGQPVCRLTVARRAYALLTEISGRGVAGVGAEVGRDGA